MIRTQLYLPEDLYAHAKLMAGLRSITISQYVRESLALRLEEGNGNGKGKGKAKKRSPLPSYGIPPEMVGKYKFGKKTTYVALNHNDIYSE